MKYAHYNEAGTIIGFYDDEIHANIPEPKLALEYDDYLVALDIRKKVVNGALIDDPIELSYIDKRTTEYPPIEEYLDGIVKGDAAQVQAYIDACLAVKAKYPKPVG
jgi:hypothetical protein